MDAVPRGENALGEPFGADSPWSKLGVGVDFTAGWTPPGILQFSGLSEAQGGTS